MRLRNSDVSRDYRWLAQSFGFLYKYSQPIVIHYVDLWLVSLRNITELMCYIGESSLNLVDLNHFGALSKMVVDDEGIDLSYISTFSVDCHRDLRLVHVYRILR